MSIDEKIKRSREIAQLKRKVELNESIEKYQGSCEEYVKNYDFSRMIEHYSDDNKYFTIGHINSVIQDTTKNLHFTESERCNILANEFTKKIKSKNIIFECEYGSYLKAVYKPK